MSEGWNILVVDDEPPIRAELRYLLEKDTRVGQIAEAGNVTEAVESILSNKPDVLFLDITMPGRSGIERDAAEPKDAASRGVCDGIRRVCGRCL